MCRPHSRVQGRALALRRPRHDKAARRTDLEHLLCNGLRVLGPAERAQIDQRVCQHLHPIMPPLDTFKAEQQAFELIFESREMLGIKE